MYPIHPLTIHLPIGLLIGHAILTVLAIRRNDRGMEQAAYHCLWLGTLLLVPAVVSGTLAAAYELVGSDTPRNDALWWINAHAISGLAVLVVYWQTWLLRRRTPAIVFGEQRRMYLLRTGLGVALLVVSGWLGGHMVYSLGVGVSR